MLYTQKNSWQKYDSTSHVRMNKCAIYSATMFRRKNRKTIQFIQRELAFVDLQLSPTNEQARKCLAPLDVINRNDVKFCDVIFPVTCCNQWATRAKMHKFCSQKQHKKTVKRQRTLEKIAWEIHFLGFEFGFKLVLILRSCFHLDWNFNFPCPCWPTLKHFLLFQFKAIFHQNLNQSEFVKIHIFFENSHTTQTSRQFHPISQQNDTKQSHPGNPWH